MLLLRLGWGWQTDRQLGRMTDELRRHGQPVRPGDVVTDVGPVADDENAWTLYRRAAAAVQANWQAGGPRNGVNEYPSYPPYGAQWDTDVAAAGKTFAAELKLVRDARARDKAQLRPGFTSWRQVMTIPELTGGRAVANLATDAAEHAHTRQDDAEAVERLFDVLHLARSLRRDPTLISQVVAGGFDALACAARRPPSPRWTCDPAGPGRRRASSCAG